MGAVLEVSVPEEPLDVLASASDSLRSLGERPPVDSPSLALDFDEPAASVQSPPSAAPEFALGVDVE
jgi:hypothetical protein